ncbi:MAG: nucleotidyltransferase [Verrucomicrobiota bacterium]|jgi:predicted nucleotidyltransferase
MKLSVDQKEFVELLNSKGVKYVLVGGHAVGFHGHPRYTGDIDFFVDVTAENARRLAEVFKEFGFGKLPFKTGELTVPQMVFQIGHPPNRIDVITSISAVEFDEAWSSRVEIEVDGLRLWVIDKELLVRNKLASGRPHDLDDARKVQKRRRTG